MPESSVPNQDIRAANAKFIVIEGIDGSGSTTQGRDLTDYFRGEGRKTVFTWEPTTGPVGMLIRLALAGRLKGRVENGFQPSEDEAAEAATDLDPLAMALLFAADRRDHLTADVIPNLRQGRTVICDRYLLSSLAYQGRSTDIDWLLEINATAIQPDLTIYLDVEAERARQRIEGTRWTEDIYESLFQQRRVREKYHAIIEKGYDILGPVVTVDASRPRDAVQSQLRQVLAHFFDTGVVMEKPQHELGFLEG